MYKSLFETQKPRSDFSPLCHPFLSHNAFDYVGDTGVTGFLANKDIKLLSHCVHWHGALLENVDSSQLERQGDGHESVN